MPANALLIEPFFDDAFGRLPEARIEGRISAEVDRRRADQTLQLALSRVDKVILPRLGFGRYCELGRVGPCRCRARLVDIAGRHHCF
jgi:hypothetical protein